MNRSFSFSPSLRDQDSYTMVDIYKRRQQVAKLYDEGMSANYMARKFNVYPYIIYSDLRAMKLPVKRQSPQPVKEAPSTPVVALVTPMAPVASTPAAVPHQERVNQMRRDIAKEVLEVKAKLETLRTDFLFGDVTESIHEFPASEQQMLLAINHMAIAESHLALLIVSLKAP